MFDNKEKRMATDKESDTTQARVQFFVFFWWQAGIMRRTHVWFEQKKKHTYTRCHDEA